VNAVGTLLGLDVELKVRSGLDFDTAMALLTWLRRQARRGER